MDPSVAVIVPCRNERDFIEDCVRQLLCQRAAPAAYEVVVVDGMSDDGTRAILGRLAGEDARVRVLDNPGRIVSSALNLGIAATASDVVIRVDGHARVAPDFVRTNLELLDEHPDAWSVGGPIVHRGRGRFARGVAAAMSSLLGAGGARHRLEDYEGYAEGAVFPAIRREVFARIGEFDEALVRNQDDEFNFRMTAAGGKIFISPRVRHEYFVRGSARKLFRQYLQYAYWKVQVMRKHKKVIAWRHLVPALFVVGAPICAVAALVAPPASFAALLPLWLYAGIVTGFFASLLAQKRDPGVAASAAAAVVIMHVAYGLGTLVGLVSPKSARRAMEGISR